MKTFLQFITEGWCNVNTKYGAWIDTRTGNIYEVERGSAHPTIVRQRLGKQIDLIITKLSKSGAYKGADFKEYVVAFSKGWVRVTYPRSSNDGWSFNGTMDDIRRAIQQVRNSIIERDSSYIGIDPVDSVELDKQLPCRIMNATDMEEREKVVEKLTA